MSIRTKAKRAAKHLLLRFSLAMSMVLADASADEATAHITLKNGDEVMMNTPVLRGLFESAGMIWWSADLTAIDTISAVDEGASAIFDVGLRAGSAPVRMRVISRERQERAALRGTVSGRPQTVPLSALQTVRFAGGTNRAAAPCRPHVLRCLEVFAKTREGQDLSLFLESDAHGQMVPEQTGCGFVYARTVFTNTAHIMYPHVEALATIRREQDNTWTLIDNEGREWAGWHPARDTLQMRAAPGQPFREVEVPWDALDELRPRSTNAIPDGASPWRHVRVPNQFYHGWTASPGVSADITWGVGATVDARLVTLNTPGLRLALDARYIRGARFAAEEGHLVLQGRDGHWVAFRDSDTRLSVDCGFGVLELGADASGALRIRVKDGRHADAALPPLRGRWHAGTGVLESATWGPVAAARLGIERFGNQNMSAPYAFELALPRDDARLLLSVHEFSRYRLAWAADGMAQVCGAQTCFEGRIVGCGVLHAETEIGTMNIPFPHRGALRRFEWNPAPDVELRFCDEQQAAYIITLGDEPWRVAAEARLEVHANCRMAIGWTTTGATPSYLDASFATLPLRDSGGQILNLALPAGFSDSGRSGAESEVYDIAQATRVNFAVDPEAMYARVVAIERADGTVQQFRLQPGELDRRLLDSKRHLAVSGPWYLQAQIGQGAIIRLPIKALRSIAACQPTPEP